MKSDAKKKRSARKNAAHAGRKDRPTTKAMNLAATGGRMKIPADSRMKKAKSLAARPAHPRGLHLVALVNLNGAAEAVAADLAVVIKTARPGPATDVHRMAREHFNRVKADTVASLRAVATREEAAVVILETVRPVGLRMANPRVAHENFLTVQAAVRVNVLEASAFAMIAVPATSVVVASVARRATSPAIPVPTRIVVVRAAAVLTDLRAANPAMDDLKKIAANAVPTVVPAEDSIATVPMIAAMIEAIARARTSISPEFSGRQQSRDCNQVSKKRAGSVQGRSVRRFVPVAAVRSVRVAAKHGLIVPLAKADRIVRAGSVAAAATAGHQVSGAATARLRADVLRENLAAASRRSAGNRQAVRSRNSSGSHFRWSAELRFGVFQFSLMKQLRCEHRTETRRIKC